MFYKSPLSAKVLTEGLLHNIGRCFDIVFPQLEVIPKTRNKFVEIVVVAERYVIVTHVKKQRIKEAAVQICLSAIIYLSS